MAGPAQIAENARYLREDFPGARVCFYGHTHDPRVFEVDGDEVRELPPRDRLFLERRKTYFVNPGSVDASRKPADKLAECAVFDSGDWSVEFLQVPYDCAAVEAKAAAFGYRITPWTERLYVWKKRLAASARSPRGKWGLSLFRGRHA
jgi:diadenosine tetraphosphatase ApaH/serine/threonine PP2A family protein phosphatase